MPETSKPSAKTIYAERVTHLIEFTGPSVRPDMCKCGSPDWHPIHRRTPNGSFMYHEFEPWEPESGGAR